VPRQAYDTAKDHALIEAAAIGANVIEVVSIEASGTDAVLVGRLPGSALTQGGGPSTGRTEARVHEVNAFHGIQGNGAALGFLVVQPPIRLISGALPDDEIVLIALRIPVLAALRLGIAIKEQGPVCCRLCNRIIPTGRLRAVKNTRLCLKCQEIKENSHR
jgi:hypothetical protein